MHKELLRAYNGLSVDNAGADGIMESTKGYWHTDLSKAELEVLNRKIRHDIKTSTNEVTDTANWMFTSINGKDVFAIYSTTDESNPTLLYESKDNRAKQERDLLIDILEVGTNGESFNGQSSFANRVSEGDWLQNEYSVEGRSDGVLGRKGSVGNAPVLQGESSTYGSPAFRNVIENLFEIQDGVNSEYSKEKNSLTAKYSFAGPSAKTADVSALERAESMEREKATAENILRETGWYRGIDGKWRFEISDDEAEFSRRGDLAFKKEHPDYGRYTELRDIKEKYYLGLEGGRELNAQEEAELASLTETWGNVFRENGRVGEGAGVQKRLESYFNHDKLYEAYPELREVELVFDDEMPEGERGSFDGKRIKLNTKNNAVQQKITLIHEIQHWIQRKEGFAQGSNPQYWENRLADEQLEKRWELQKRKQSAFDKMTEDFRKKVLIQLPHLEDVARIKGDYSAVLDFRQELFNDPENAEAYEEYEDAEWELDELRKKDINLEARKNYHNTAGEIEARDASARMNMTEAERRESMPYRGNGNTVFADDSMISFDEDNKKTAEGAVDSGAQNDIIEGNDYIKEGDNYASRNNTGRISGISTEDRNKAGRSNADTENVSAGNAETSLEEKYTNIHAGGENATGGNEGSLGLFVDNVQTTVGTVGQTTQGRRFLKALNSGDRKTAREILDEHAMSKGYEPVNVYHGTHAEEPFTSFRNNGAAHWVSTSEKYSKEGYAPDYEGGNPLAEQLFTEKNSAVYDLYIKKGKVLDLGDINAEINSMEEIFAFAKKIGFKNSEILRCWNAGSRYEGRTIWMMSVTSEFAEIARQKGYDTLRATERDGVETFGVLYPENLKSAKLETFDDNGNLISLEKRFNDSADDIRFSMPKPTSQAQYEDRAYKLERDMRSAIEEKLGAKLSDESLQAVQGVADSIAKGDEARIRASLVKLFAFKNKEWNNWWHILVLRTCFLSVKHKKHGRREQL